MPICETHGDISDGKNYNDTCTECISAMFRAEIEEKIERADREVKLYADVEKLKKELFQLRQTHREHIHNVGAEYTSTSRPRKGN